VTRPRLAQAIPALLLMELGLLLALALELSLDESVADDRGMLVTLIISAVAAALGRFLLAQHVLLQTSRATHAMRAIADGEETSPLPPSRAHEMASFTESFNVMLERLQRSRQLLMRQAFIDPLTGLANRASFMTNLATALTENRGRNVAVVFVDLDRFKNVNDSLGHGVGDALLTVVASRLQAAAGPGVLVARLGGDEFTLLVKGDGAASAALHAAEDFVRRMERPIAVTGHELFISASAGVALGERHSTATELLRRADIALYRAKAEGRSRVVLFRMAQHDVPAEQLELDSALRHAVERGQLRLFYQPEVNLKTGRVEGMEALLRWDHPHLGVLLPAQFLDIAEDSGEIRAISQWVILQACRQAVAFGERLPGARGLIVSINLTGPEFRDPGLVERVSQALAESGLEPGRLRIELTENLLVEDVQTTVRTLHGLRQIGVALAIDDFGTGYSSLSYIQDFEVGTLKVDQSFVRRIGIDKRSDAIITAIGDLAHTLEMELTAEGVETLEQLEFLRAQGYHRAQGHFISAPLEGSEFEAFLRARPAEAPALRPVRRSA
jgi:diguanylate cyclase (GGDEF)-like protein